MATAFSGEIDHGEGTSSYPRSKFNLTISYSISGNQITFTGDVTGTYVSLYGSYYHYLYLTIYVNGTGYSLFSGNLMGYRSSSGGSYNAKTFSNSITTPLLNEGTSATFYAESAFNQGGSSGSSHSLSMGDSAYDTIDYTWKSLGSGTASSISFSLSDHQIGYYYYTPSSNGTLTIYTTNMDDSYGGIASTNNGSSYLGLSSDSSATGSSIVTGDDYILSQNDDTNGTQFQCSNISVIANTTYEIFVHNYYGSADSGTLYMAFTPSTYTITYNANGGSGTTNSQTVTIGKSITLQANGFTAPSSAVHGITLYDSDGTTQISSSYASFQNNIFYKWLIGSTYYQPGATYTPASNTTVKATWSTNYKLNSASKQSTSSAGYIITYNPNGGNCSREEDIITDTIYYDFSKWISISSGNEYESGSILGGPNAYSYKAKWTTSKELGSIILPNAYKNNSEIIATVTLNPNKGKCDIISMTSKGITTYSFNGWYSGNNYIGTVGTSYTPSSNITLTANYTSSTGSYNQIFLPTPYRSGYKFLGWSANPDANSGIFGYYTPTGNDTLYAIWQENIIFININGSIKKVQAFIFNDNKWNKIQTFISSNDQWNKTG